MDTEAGMCVYPFTLCSSRHNKLVVGIELLLRILRFEKKNVWLKHL